MRSKQLAAKATSPLANTFPAVLLGLLCAVLLSTGCAVEPPISVNTRESLVGQGIVVELTNTSDKFLHEVVVSIKSPEGEVKTWTTATLDPHDSVRVGWAKLDGWPIPKGAKVTIKCKGYLMESGPWDV